MKFHIVTTDLLSTVPFQVATEPDQVPVEIVETGVPVPGDRDWSVKVTQCQVTTVLTQLCPWQDYLWWVP